MNSVGRYDTAPPAPPQAPERKRVLVVDDDQLNLKLLKSFLGLDGYEVLLAASGPEALAMLEKGPVDLVVLDVRMPEMDGYEVCRRIRADPRNARMPVVFLTADQADEARELLGLDAGGDEYLHKPITRKLLSARVKNLIRLADAERDRRLMQQVAHAEKLAVIGQVAAGVAHEVNNPLSFVLSNLDSLKGYIRDLVAVVEAWRESEAAGRAKEAEVGLAAILADLTPLLEETLQGGRRVRGIVNELKSFARQDEVLLEEVDLAEVVRSTLVLTERELVARAAVRRDLAPAVLPRAPRQKLHQVVLNLVVNAMQAVDARPLPPGQRHALSVSTRTEGDQVVLEVSDTGCGMSEEVRQRIFEPFFTTKPVGVGTGLGLSVCLVVVEGLKGQIAVESEVGQGSRFILTLPRAAPPPRQDS